MASVILDFYDEDASSSLLGSLDDSDLESFALRPALFDLGALVFMVPKQVAEDNPTLLRKTNLVRVRFPASSGSTHEWVGVLKDTRSVILSKGEEAGEYVEWTAPGGLFLLSYGALGTASTVSDQPARGSYDDVPARDWIWINEPYGAIITRVIEEGRHSPFPDAAAADSPFEDIDIDFSRDLDSAGNPWATIAEEFRVPIGSNMLETIAQLATAGDVFLIMDPDLTLHAYQDYADFSEDRTGGFSAGNVRWQRDINILTELSRQSEAIPATHLIQRDSDGNLSTEVASGYTSGREHYAYAESDSTNDDTTLNKIAQRTIDASASDAEQIAFEIVPGEDSATGEYFPYTYFDVGDLVTLDTGSGSYDFDEASLRIVAFRITLDQASKSDTDAQAYKSLHVVVELAYRPLHTWSTVRSQLGDPGATPGCTCTRLCQEGTAPTPGTPPTGASVLFTRTWDYEDGDLNSTLGDYPWGNAYQAAGTGYAGTGGAFATAYGRATGSYTPVGTKMPCTAGGDVTIEGEIARNWFSDATATKKYRLRFYVSAGSPDSSYITSELLSPAPCSRHVASSFSFTRTAPVGATYFNFSLQDNASQDNVTVTSYDTDGTPGTPGDPGGLGAGCAPADTTLQDQEERGTCECAAHGDHSHAHGLLAEDEPNYHPPKHLSSAGAADGDVLTWDDTAGEWVPAAPGASSGAAPDDVDYLVGTASPDLSGEIVVGTTPGGELGGTWASPTVESTHAGSNHLQPVRKNSTGSDFTRRRLNLIEGTNVTLTVADDAGNDEVDITIAASGGSSGVVVQEGDSTVAAAASTLDFGTGFDVTESPANEANIALDLLEVTDFTDHSARHESAGADAIKLDDFATPDDNTDLDATTGHHGLLKKLGGGTVNYLRADGTWATPSGSAPVPVGYATRVPPVIYGGGANRAGTAGTGYLLPFNVPNQMYLRSFRIRITTTGTGTVEFGLFDYTASRVAASKVAGGTKVFASTGWQDCDVSGGPVLIAPGSYMLIFRQPSTGTVPQISGNDETAGWGAKSQASYTWDDTPDLTSGWSDYTSTLAMFLRGDLDGSGSTW